MQDNVGRTFAQKALERASREKDLQPGQIVDAFPDLYMSHTASWRCIWSGVSSSPPARCGR